jgi:hypothetical protein
MVVLEYRIPLPVTVDEFQVAQLYMVMKASEENTGGGEGVEVLKNEPYDNTDGKMDKAEISKVSVPKNKGQYTLKKYYIGSRLPAFARAVVPSDSLFLFEEAWNAYPHCKTVLTNGYLSVEKFSIEIETWHCPDNGHQDNAVKLEKDELKIRKIHNIDISDDMSDKDDYKEEYDPAKFKSEKTGRGLLSKGWEKEADPVMTAYKVVRANFKYFGLQTKMESLIEGFETTLFTSTLRQAFCLIDEWYGLTMVDIRKLEREAAERLEKKRNEEGAVAGGYSMNK